MLESFAQWVQSTQLSQWLAGSTWGYPVVGALHVVGVAWVGGALLASLLLPARTKALQSLLRIGAAYLLLTGALCFVVEPVHCVESESFWLKMLLLAGLVAAGLGRRRVAIPVTLTIWFGVLLASRGIAFF
jgi:hypothetical protein